MGVQGPWNLSFIFPSAGHPTDSHCEITMSHRWSQNRRMSWFPSPSWIYGRNSYKDFWFVKRYQWKVKPGNAEGLDKVQTQGHQNSDGWYELNVPHLVRRRGPITLRWLCWSRWNKPAAGLPFTHGSLPSQNTACPGQTSRVVVCHHRIPSHWKGTASPAMFSKRQIQNSYIMTFIK